MPQALQPRIRIPAREKQGLFSLPNRAKQTLTGFDGMEPEITLKRQRRIQTLLGDMPRHFDERRTILRNKTRNQQLSGPVHQIKRAPVRIGDPCRSFDNQPVKIRRA